MEGENYRAGRLESPHACVMRTHKQTTFFPLPLTCCRVDALDIGDEEVQDRPVCELIESVCVCERESVCVRERVCVCVWNKQK